ncbi:MAG TPA: histidine phosphatase family protein, partial [Spirochaetota bacterium]|nr:histidine phosphatase family protein [Spirochaetota bacterium]
MKIYLVRHGETDWNVKKLMQGWKDSPLTERGVENAKKLSNRLKYLDFQYIFCSPANRALKT